MVHRKAVSINRKGITLETAVALILIVLSLAIVIILFFTTGLISNLQAEICTTLTTAGSLVRGFVIKQIWVVYDWLLIIVGVILVTGSTCRAFPYGTAVCAATYAIFVVILTASFGGLTAGLPLVYCPNPTIIHGVGNCSDSKAGVSSVTLFREVADRSVDCWSMYGSGQFDPLSGREPPNPITCFVIDFKLPKDQAISMNDIKDWLHSTNYSAGVTYWSKAGSGTRRLPGTNVDLPYDNIVVRNVNSDTKLVKGRIFIKYGDDYIFAKWQSADCAISGSAPVAGDHLYWCLDKSLTCDSDCNSLKGGTCT